MTTPQEMIWEALGRPDWPRKKPAKPATCAFCGVVEGDIRATEVIRDGFTNVDRLAFPASEVVCVPCAVSLREPKLRSSSWLVEPGSIKYFKREEVSGVLFGEKRAPFLLYVTTSFKKVGQAKVLVNYDWQHFELQFEEVRLLFNAGAARPVFDILRLFYSIPAHEVGKAQPKSFFTKDEMRTGDYQPARVRAFGVDEWFDAEEKIGKYRGSALLNLLLYALSQECFGRESNTQQKRRNSNV